MENRVVSISYYMAKTRPYSMRRYEHEARELMLNRMAQVSAGLSWPREGLSEYGAGWSTLARRRRIGVLITLLYTIAVKENIDMTSIYAHRLLQGMVGRSITNKVLNPAFGVHGRTAADKSADWDRLDEIVSRYRDVAQRALQRDKERQALVKRRLQRELNFSDYGD
ncbi:hypothetical protein V8N76_004538 [Salmonella enterica]